MWLQLCAHDGRRGAESGGAPVFRPPSEELEGIPEDEDEEERKRRVARQLREDRDLARAIALSLEEMEEEAAPAEDTDVNPEEMMTPAVAPDGRRVVLVTGRPERHTTSSRSIEDALASTDKPFNKKPLPPWRWRPGVEPKAMPQPEALPQQGPRRNRGPKPAVNRKGDPLQEDETPQQEAEEPTTSPPPLPEMLRRLAEKGKGKGRGSILRRHGAPTCRRKILRPLLQLWIQRQQWILIQRKSPRLHRPLRGRPRQR